MPHLDNMHEFFTISATMLAGSNWYYFDHNMEGKEVDYISISGSSQGDSNLFRIIVARKSSTNQLQLYVAAQPTNQTGVVVFNVVLCRIT